MIKTEFGTKLKSKLLSGIQKLNDSVSSTLGPSGRNVIIHDELNAINVTKDGVTVAKNFTKLEDPLENIGVQMVKEVAIKSADKAGDGTTTSTLLATVMIQEGMRVIERGNNPVEIKKGIDMGVKAVISRLRELSNEITTEEQIKQVATVSANGDVEIGNLIATALEKVGNDGVVAIEESKTGETSLEIVEGMMIDRGYKSPYFVTDNNLMQAILETPNILIYDGRITTSAQIVPILQAAHIQNKSLLVIAEDIDGEALPIMIVNKAQGTIKAVAVKAPDFGDRRTAILEDIAVLTGGTVLSANKGHKLEKMDPTSLANAFGKCRMVTVSSKDTTIIDGKNKMVTAQVGVDEKGQPVMGEVSAITERLSEIKNQIDVAKSTFEIEKLQERLSKLIGGVAIINVGGLSEIEMKEKKDRVDDALHATKAALDQGIVPGGGIALINCVEAVQLVEPENFSQKLGLEVVKKCLYAPFMKILSNAGIEDSFYILNEIKNKKVSSDNPEWEGYNVKTGEFVNLLEEGILDPTKVTKTALENAASVAGTILTTESIVYNLDEPKTDRKNESEF
jgi:chaperonin GroEL